MVKNYRFYAQHEMIYLHIAYLQGMPHYNEIQAEVDEYITKGSLNFVLDLAELQFIDSVGLSLLITILTKSRHAGGDVFLLSPTPKVEKMLMITKLQHLFKVIEPIL